MGNEVVPIAVNGVPCALMSEIYEGQRVEFCDSCKIRKAILALNKLQGAPESTPKEIGTL